MVLHSPAIHNLDLMNLFLGRATSLVALAAKSIQEDVEYSDIVGVLIGYEHGRVGSLGATVSDPLYRQATGTSSARIVGDAGGLAFDVSTGRIELQTLSGPLQRFEIKTEDWGLDSGIAEELINFEAVIHNRAAPFVNSEEALRAVELCEAAEQSIQSGSIVRLPLTNGRSL
jgi:predicted dehydrogenase